MLRAAVVIGLLTAVTSVAAVERGDDGYGQVLLFPYFSASDELSTLASVSRTVSPTDRSTESLLAISVVVRIDSGDESGSLSSEHFTVLLPAHSTWSFALVPTDGRTALVTDSSACAYRQDEPLADGPAVFADSGSEGWIEAYVLGRGNPTLELDALLRAQQCAEIAARLEGLTAAEWLVPAGNELRGTSHLVDVPSGTSYSLPTVALRDFAESPPWGFGQEPTLADVDPPIARVVASSGERLDATFSEHPVDAVSAVLMDAQWEMDFTSEATLAARTDLVVVAPTRRWYVSEEATRAPFASHPGLAPDGAVRTVGRLHDRDGNQTTPPEARSPQQAKCSPAPSFIPQPGPNIATSVVVVQFAPQPTLSSARTVVQQHLIPDDGQCFTAPLPVWERITSGRFALRFDLSPDNGVGGLVSDEGHQFTGLPVIGAGITKAVNGDVAGSLANFGLVQWISRTAGSP